MIEFTREELNQLGACVNIVVQHDGIQAARALLPLFDKIETMAVEMDKNKTNPIVEE